VDEKVENSDLERVGGVGVDLEVGFEDEKAALFVGVARRDKWWCGRGESGGETGGVEIGRVGLFEKEMSRQRGSNEDKKRTEG